MDKLTRRIECNNHRLAWAVIGEKGAIHVWCCAHDFTSGGIEMHSREPMYDGQAVSHVDCWLIGKNCHHDGSSLQYRDWIRHRIGFVFGDTGHHANPNESLWMMLATEYRTRFECEAEIDWTTPVKGGA